MNIRSNANRLRLPISVTAIVGPVIALCIIASASLAEDVAHSKPVSFRRDVRGILSNHCFACHGPDETHREADMRLDIASDFDLAAALERITSDDPDMIMPPPSTTPSRSVISMRCPPSSIISLANQRRASAGAQTSNAVCSHPISTFPQTDRRPSLHSSTLAWPRPNSDWLLWLSVTRKRPPNWQC